MLINQNTNTFIPTVFADVSTGNLSVTADGVYLSRNYYFDYEIQGQTKKLKRKVTGSEMLQSFMKVANFFADDVGSTNINDIRRLISAYVTAYATRYISKSAYAKLRKQFKCINANSVSVVKKAIAGDSYNNEIIDNMIAAYMYVKHINANANVNADTLYVFDRPIAQATINKWVADFDNQPMVLQGAVKTKAEYKQLLELGGLETNWN